MADFVANWLRASSNQIKIYSSQIEGAWDFFVKDPQVDIGCVFIHESTIVSICEVSNSRGDPNFMDIFLGASLHCMT